MKLQILITILSGILFAGCSNGQTKTNSGATQQSKTMEDDFQFTLKSAHPNAQALMTDEFYFSPIAESGPFGSDDGWEAAYGFRDWRRSHKTTSPVVFLKELIAEWNYPFFDYNEMDTTKIKEFLNQKKELSEAEIQQQIEMMKEMQKKMPDSTGREMDDKHWREVILTSSQNMNGIFLLGQDNAIIGIGFAQFVLEGHIDNDIRDLTLKAITRQLLPVLINRYDDNIRDKRKEQLTKMLAVINKAGS